MTKKVCMFVTNPVTGDPRVEREASTLVQGGYRVVVIGLRGAEDSPEEWLNGYQIIRLKPPELLTARQAILAALIRLSPGLHDGLRAAYRVLRYGSRAPVIVPSPLQPAPQPSEASAPCTRWQKLQIDQLAIRCIFWLNVEMANVAVQQGADIFHSHDLDTLLAGYLSKRWTGKPLVYDFHELYTEQFQSGVKSPLWRLWYSALEWRLIKKTDHRLTVCDSLGEWVERRYGVNRPITVMNVPTYRNVPSIRASESTTKVVLYHGVYLPDRGLEQLIESAQYLERGEIVLRGFGPLEDQLRALVQEKGLEKLVSFAPPVAVAELIKAASEADIGVIPYVPVSLNNRFCLPNKLFEYMMAGLAIAGSDLPELRRIILGHDLGVVFNPEDPQDIARALNELLADEASLDKMRRNVYVASKTLFNWDQEGQKLLRLYDSVLGLDRSSLVSRASTTATAGH